MPSSDQPASRNPTSSNRAFDDGRANDPNLARSSAGLREFVGQVQRLTGLETEEETETLARATLRKLGARISSGQARDLTGALPAELTAEMVSQNTPQASAFDKHELVDQISGEVHSVDAEKVERQVVAVLQTLAQWVPDDQVDDTLAQLPGELAALFR